MPSTAPLSTLQVLDARFAKVAAGAGALERLCTGAIWSEGPVWIDEAQTLLWSDIPNNRMLSWHAARGMAVWRAPAEFTNGHVRDLEGRLLHCSHGLRAIVRTRLGANAEALGDEVLVERYQGRRFNSPNDIVVKRDGTLWFTDPPYGILSNREGYQAESELGQCFVFRFDPRNGSLRVVSNFLEHPNGLAFSPDESVLYVSDTSAALSGGNDGTDGGGHHHIVAFDVVGGEDLARPRVFATIEPGLADGFRLDVHSFLYTSTGDSVQVFHPDGTLLAVIPVPEKVGNVCFGGAAGDELYICASSSLYRIRLNTRGATA